MVQPVALDCEFLVKPTFVRALFPLSSHVMEAFSVKVDVLLDLVC